MQRHVARRHRAHQHVGAARGVLGQRLIEIGAERLALAAEAKASKAMPAPQVLSSATDHAGRSRTSRSSAGRSGKLHRHRARRLEPDQAGRRRSARRRSDCGSIGS
mgnify:CR=1 FL=1